MAQNEIIIIEGREITAKKKRSEIISQIEAKKQITISYSSGKFEDMVIQKLPEKALNLELFISQLFEGYVVKLEPVGDKKYVLNVKELKLDFSGHVFDKITGEVLIGALIFDEKGVLITTTDETGYYHFRSRPGTIVIQIKYLGYVDLQFIEVRSKSDHINHYLVSDNIELPEFSFTAKQLTDPVTEVIRSPSILSKMNVLGEKDIFNELKTTPGVNPGSEGNTGLSIRGGSPDQNLILFEGMPIYESYHTGSLASIFIDESIRTTEFSKSGLPARYGGRLNSVISVQLKDGNKNKRESKVIAGLQGITFFNQGPVYKEKLSYAISLRTSWINSVLKPFKSLITLYDEINLNYQDAQVKLSYQIDAAKKLSFAAYIGRDKLKLVKNGQENIAAVNEFNGANKIMSLNYDHLVNKKMKMHVQAGFLKYSVFSRGQFAYYSDRGDTTLNLLDVINESNIIDYQLNYNIDYYANDRIKLKSGISFINHSYNPAVKQSISNENKVIVKIASPDSAIGANETNAFAEINYNIKNKLYIVPGFYYAAYHAYQNTYTSFQPRVQILYNFNPKFTMNVAYTSSAQFIHLLANTGLGLPSELWVPSGPTIPAEKIKHINYGVAWNVSKHTSISSSLYIKYFNDLVEYIEPVDLFLDPIKQVANVPILNSERDWERKTEIGDGSASGIEFAIKSGTEKLQLWLSYHYGRSYRTFEKINKGDRYVTKYDKPHNVNAGINFHINSEWNLTANWVYSSGQPFTLADERISGFGSLGITFIQASSKNNYRMPAFHQLSLNASHIFKLREVESKLDFGIYNIYNRLNSFYIYATNTQSNDLSYRKVSLFPILPQLSLTVKW